MRSNELWQAFSFNGDPILDGGYPAAYGTQNQGEDLYLTVCVVWLYRYNASGDLEILFQRRSPYVDHNANFWDASAGGHVNYQESFTSAAVREAKEELGVTLDPQELEFVFEAASIDGTNVRKRHYLYDWTDQDDNFKFNDQEVSEVEWVPFFDFNYFAGTYTKPQLANDIYTRTTLRKFLKIHGNYPE